MNAPRPDDADSADSAVTAAEEELIERLEEACALDLDAPGVKDTGELVKLEAALQSAAKAAEKAIDLRRERRRRQSDDLAPGVREFPDRDGRRWRLWAVAPGQHGVGRGSLERLRREYQQGWLAFESVDGLERRRLPGVPANVAALTAAQLQELLAAATHVPRRR
jgi:hypothetical protein